MGPKSKCIIPLCSSTCRLKVILIIFLVCVWFACDPSHKVKCGIFHWWDHVGAQKALDFGAFQMFGVGMLNLYYYYPPPFFFNV